LAYLQQNQLPEAEAEFRKVVALAPDQAVGYADLGLVYLREGRYRDAEAQLRRAAAFDSADSNIGLMLARVYELTGREAEARREVERVLRRDSTDIRALYAAGELAGRSADPEERRRQEGYLRRVVARAPANLAARLELVDLLLARGAADDAAAQLEALQRELPQLPPEAARFFQRALRSARAGRASEAAAQRFHHAMEVTAAYQASLQRLGGRIGGGAALLPGRPAVGKGGPSARGRACRTALPSGDGSHRCLPGQPAAPGRPQRPTRRLSRPDVQQEHRRAHPGRSRGGGGHPF